MKKIFISVIVVAIVFHFLGCTKSIGTNMNTPASVYKPIELAGDPAFVGLNDALNHFDPHYLQLVYGDQRSTAEINDSSRSLFSKLQQQPDNVDLQNQLVAFYKLNSVNELKYYSNQITVHLNDIKNRYFLGGKIFTVEDIKMYFNAKSIYAKNRMDSISGNGNKIKTSSMYEDYVLFPQSPAFGFFSEMDLEGLDAGGDCADECCFQWQACNLSARAKYLDNFYNTKFNTVASAVVVGGALGSAYSPAGAITGSLIGLNFGTYIGTSVAAEIFSLDKDACTFLYKACVIKSKKTN
jgi:hypothetical protein